MHVTEPDRQLLSANSLLKDKVINARGEELGTIKDFMMDYRRGIVAYAVLSFGGFLGLGDKLFAVPWRSLKLDADRHAFVLDVDKETLKRAPGFDKDKWPDMNDRTWGESIHGFYKVPVYWLEHEETRY